MILSLDILDYGALHERYSRYPLRQFGLVMAWSAQASYSGILAQGENLYIAAHGAPDSIGHPGGEPRFSAAGLADWLEQSTLPCNFAGNIFLAAPGSTPGYLDALRMGLGGAFAGEVFGLFDRAYGEILPAGHPDWHRSAVNNRDLLHLSPASSQGNSAA